MVTINKTFHTNETSQKFSSNHNGFDNNKGSRIIKHKKKRPL